MGTDIIPATPPAPLDPKGQILMPAIKSPGFRRQLAVERGVQNNILIKTWGGLGDEVCAIPTVTFALETFKGKEVHLAAMRPEFFRHLNFGKVYNLLTGPFPDWDRYHTFDAMCSHGDIPWDYICHVYTHCIDANSLYAFRCQLPLSYKEIKLFPNEKEKEKINNIINENLLNHKWVIVHPGQHWESKTFPVKWWNDVLARLKKENVIPVIVGGTQKPQNPGEFLRTTVNIDNTGCLDLRNKLELMETVALIQRSNVVLTNDSCILHFAAASEAWCGFVTMAKHPDYIKHYRHGRFGWRMENLSKGGLWEITDVLDGIAIMDIGEENMQKWLPQSEDFAEWALEKL